MNGLNNSSLFPYSLNNLQQISTTDGGSLPVTCDVPLIKTLTTSAQEISLFESSPDLIDFNTFNKSLRVKELFAGTGSFNNIYATGARFLTLNATGINCNTLNATTSIFSNGSLNAPAANITCFGINSVGGLIQTTNGFTGPFITANSGTFQNVNTNTLTANTIVINTVNIPNLSYTTATGVNTNTTNLRSASGTITNLTTSNLTSTGGFSCRNINITGQDAGYAILQNDAFALNQFAGNTNFVNQVSVQQDATFSKDIEVLGYCYSNLFTGPQGRIEVFSANTGTFTNLSFGVATGGNLFVNNLTATNSVFSASSMNAPAANIQAFALTASGFVNAPSFSGATANFGNLRVNTGTFNSISATGMNLTNLTFTTATGGTLSSSLVVRNPQTLAFSKTDGTQIVRVEPAGVADVLSFFNPGGVLQTLYTTTSSGANVDNLNQLGTKDITNLSRIFNGDGTQALPSYSFINDSDTGFYRTANNIVALGLGNRRNVLFNPDNVFFGSGASNRVDVDIFGELHIGGTNNANSALMNLGYSGSIFGVNNSRMGFITTDGTTLEINHQQASTGSTSVGQISLIPGNDSNLRLLKQPNGILSNNSRNDGYGHQFANLQTGGLGMLTTLVNKPDSAYLFSSQGPGFNSAITMHGSLGGQMSNITAGRTNFPFTNNEFFTGRPWSPTGSTSLCMKVSNQVSETNGFGTFGMFASGTTLTRNHTYISNSAVLGGISFHTNDTATVPTTYPRYLIDVAGFHYFSSKSATGVFEITSQPFAVGIGESFTTTRGNGRWLPVAKGALNNTSYTGGSEFIARGTADSNNDHSAYTSNGFSADHKGFYRIQWNVNGSFATAADTLFIRVKVAGITRNVCTAQFPVTGQLGNSTGYCLFNCNASDDIDLFFQADTRLFTCANDSYFQIEYVG